MGKGDKKTKKGKIHIGTFGVKRRRRVKKAAATAAPKKEGKKTTAKAKKAK